MNQEERDWLEWLKRVKDGVVTQQQAAEKREERAWFATAYLQTRVEGGLLDLRQRELARERALEASHEEAPF